jgi:hypothetical protein
LTTLDLTLNVVGRHGATSIFAVAKHAPRLQRILLPDNFLSNDSVEDLASQLLAHPTLFEIDLRGNPISHVAGKRLHSFVKSSGSRVTKVVLDDTLINPALVRIIGRQCQANEARLQAEAEARDEAAQPQPLRVLELLAEQCVADTTFMAFRVLMSSSGIVLPRGQLHTLPLLEASVGASRSNVNVAALNILWQSATNLEWRRPSAVVEANDAQKWRGMDALQSVLLESGGTDFEALHLVMTERSTREQRQPALELLALAAMEHDGGELVALSMVVESARAPATANGL